MLTNAAHTKSRLVWVIVIATLVLSAMLWSGRPFVWFGWVAGERPKPTGPASVSVADLVVPLPLPGGTGTAPVPLLLWYPTPTPRNAPFVMYGPAWGGDRSDNVALAAELASRGFVVAAYDDIARDPPELDASSDDAVVRKSQLEVDTDAGRARTLAVFDRRVELQAAKVVRLLDALERAPSLLPADVTISMARVGMIGASFGGAAAAEVAQRDPRKRIGAAVNLDGWIHGEAAARMIEMPLVTFNSTRGVPAPAEVNSANPVRKFFAMIDARGRAIMARQLAARGDSIDLTIAGAAHSDFMEQLYDPRRWTQWRPWRERMIRPERMREIVDAYVGAFFEEHLKGTPSPLLRASKSPYREVTVELGKATVVRPKL